MGCQCAKKRITYSCLHQDTKVEKCWREGWRQQYPCLGVLVPACDAPRSLRKKRFGFCAKCAAHFGLPRRPARYNKKYVERYLEYKSHMGIAKEKIKAKCVPLHVVLDDADIERMASQQRQQQSPMRARRRRSSATLTSTRARGISGTGIKTTQQQGHIPNGLYSAFSVSDDEDDNDNDSDDGDAEVFEMELMSSSLQSNNSIKAPIPVRPYTTNNRTSMDVVDAPWASRLLSLRDEDVAELAITEVSLELDEFDSVVIQRPVPKLGAAPAPRRHRRNSRARRYFEPGQRSPWSPSGFEKRVRGVRSRRSFCVPCPPPPVVGRVFTGRCNEHNPRRPQIGCRTCAEGTYLEAGIPTAEDQNRLKFSRSAPPILIRTQMPASKFECAVQKCFCDLVDDQCLTCKEREKQAELLGAAFF